MKARLPVWGIFVCFALSLVGCGSKDPNSLGAQKAKLFQSADPQVKSQWDTAMAALKTNGFVTVIVTMKKLQEAQLTPEQLKAVNETVTAVSDQMYEASNKGDANAAQAIQDLRKVSGR